MAQNCGGFLRALPRSMISSLRVFSFRALALVALCGSPALIAPRPAQGQPLPDRAPLSGVLLNAKGEPVAGAQLSLRRVNSDLAVAFWGATAASDDAGQFVFPDAEIGDYYLTAEAPGYATIVGRLVEWRTGAPPVRLTMERLVELELQLSAPDGSPVAQAPVFARLRPADINDQTAQTALSDDEGRLRITNVKPGTYALYLRAPAGFATLQNLEISDGANAPRPLRLQEAGALRVQVADSLGRALGGATLSLAPATIEEARRLGGDFDGPGDDYALLAAGNNRSLMVSRDGDGSIELDGLPPGRYAPRLFLPGYNFEDLPPVTIQAGAPTELRAQAPSRRARTLTLQLRTPDDRPYTAGEIALRILPIAANGQMGGDPPPNPDDADELPFFPSGPGGRRALPDAQGVAELFPVKAGRYRIFAAPRRDDPNQKAPEATPVDVTIGATGATATVIVPNN